MRRIRTLIQQEILRPFRHIVIKCSQFQVIDYTILNWLIRLAPINVWPYYTDDVTVLVSKGRWSTYSLLFLFFHPQWDDTRILIIWISRINITISYPCQTRDFCNITVLVSKWSRSTYSPFYFYFCYLDQIGTWARTIRIVRINRSIMLIVHANSSARFGGSLCCTSCFFVSPLSSVDTVYDMSKAAGIRSWEGSRVHIFINCYT